MRDERFLLQIPVEIYFYSIIGIGLILRYIYLCYLGNSKLFMCSPFSQIWHTPYYPSYPRTLWTELILVLLLGVVLLLVLEIGLWNRVMTRITVNYSVRVRLLDVMGQPSYFEFDMAYLIFLLMTLFLDKSILQHICI